MTKFHEGKLISLYLKAMYNQSKQSSNLMLIRLGQWDICTRHYSISEFNF